MKKMTIFGLCTMLVLALTLTACSSGLVATTTAITIKSVSLAESLNTNAQPVNPKTQFKPADTIYVSVDMAGRPTTGKLNGKFYFGDQLISEFTYDFATANQGLISTLGTDTYAGFNLTPSSPWPVDTSYRFVLAVNGTKIGDYPYAVIQ
jgi:hypothetical protein